MNNRHHFIEAQVNTQQYGRRPYGVGLLVIGHDVRVKHVSKKKTRCLKMTIRKLDLIFLNVLLLVQALNIMLCLLVLDLNPLKHILKNTMKNLQMVNKKKETTI